jgi:hypothetical protein
MPFSPSRRMGFVNPNSLRLRASLSSCAGVWVLEFDAYGTSDATGRITILFARFTVADSFIA